jgi:hypothetical protein
MTEDLEDLYDPNEEKAAEYLSEVSYSDALADYVVLGGSLFAPTEVRNVCHGERLAKRIEFLAKSLQFEQVLLKPFDEDDYEVIVAALTLPAMIRYNEFEYVIKGGDYDDGKFRREEQWTNCDETDIRDLLVKAVYFFCIQGATLAKKYGSERARRLFIKAYIEIANNCIMSDIPYACCGKNTANSIVRWIALAVETLWGDLKIKENEDKWRQFEENLTLMTSEPPQDDANGSSNNQEVYSEYVITLGGYASKIIKSIDNQTRTVVFYGQNGKQDEQIVVPTTARKAWEILKLLAESSDGEGVVELPEELRYWRAHFRRARKLDDGGSVALKTDLDKLKAHIVSVKGPGKRGLPKVHLVASASRDHKFALVGEGRKQKKGKRRIK